MKALSKKLEIVVFVITLTVLITIWAVNGFEDTWLYTVFLLIILPPSWFYFGKNRKDK